MLAHARVALDHHVRVEHRPPTQAHPVPDDAERPHLHARLEHGPRRDPREGVDVGRGQGRHLEQQPGLGRAGVAHPHLALEADEIAPAVHEPNLEAQLVAGHHGPAELRLVEADHPDLDPARVGSRLEQPDAGGLCERLEDQDARHHRLRGEVAGEEVLGPGHVLHRHQPPRGVVLEDPVHEHERVLGGNLADEPSDLAGAHAGRGPRRVRARRRE